jgi:hypothetical protein
MLSSHERGTSLDIPRSYIRHTVLFVCLAQGERMK